MNSKKVIIYEYDTLFNILNEIKNNLNFDLIKANKNNIKNEEKFIKSDYLIISRSEKNSLNFHLTLDKIPIKIESLLETINLKFLRHRFNSQSDISIGKYKLNLNSREISKNNLKINLTEREINLILFLNKSRIPVKIDKLQKEVWAYGDKLETHTVETHIYRLRKKLKEKFQDDYFILSSKNGYFLNEKKK